MIAYDADTTLDAQLLVPNNEPVNDPVNDPVLICDELVTQPGYCAEELTTPSGRFAVTCVELLTVPAGTIAVALCA